MGTYRDWFLERQKAHAQESDDCQKALDEAQGRLKAALAATAQGNKDVADCTAALNAATAKLKAANDALALMQEPTIDMSQANRLYTLQAAAQ